MSVVEDAANEPKTMAKIITVVPNRK
jgi:hypothetical protein